MSIFFIGGAFASKLGWTIPEFVSLTAFVSKGVKSSFDLFETPLWFLIGERVRELPFAGEDTEFDFFYSMPSSSICPRPPVFVVNLLISFRL